MIARYLASETYNAGKQLQPWVDAFRAIDEEKDNAPLIKLLNSNTRIPALARLYLADLLERKKFRHAKHPSAPLYKFTDRVSKLLRAVEAVRFLHKYERRPREEAIEKAAALYRLRPDAVRVACDGRDRGLRVAAKQRPHLKTSFHRP
jgi:hypothetical protein